MSQSNQGLGLAAANGVAQAQQPVQVICPLTPVSPRIEIRAPKLVLVRKPYQIQANATPHRIAVKLKASRSFGGQGQLTHNAGAGIEIYAASRGGAPLVLPYSIVGGQLSHGVTLYIQAATPSGAMNDTILTLTLVTGEPTVNNPATDQMTRIELHLDLCAYKPAVGGADPPPLPGEQRVDPGRTLHVQTKERVAGRLMAAVRRTTPNDYTGNVILKQVNDRIRPYPYAQEVPPLRPQPLDAKQQMPLSTPNAAIDLANGVRLWVEGRKVSGALQGYRLHPGNQRFAAPGG